MNKVYTKIMTMTMNVPKSLLSESFVSFDQESYKTSYLQLRQETGGKLTSSPFSVKESEQHLLYTMITEEASFSDNLAGQFGDCPMDQQQTQIPR